MTSLEVESILKEIEELAALPETVSIMKRELNKQVPKKVETETATDNGISITGYWCPNCKASLELNDNVGDAYCCECGQRLEW